MQPAQRDDCAAVDGIVAVANTRMVMDPVLGRRIGLRGCRLWSRFCHWCDAIGRADSGTGLSGAASAVRLDWWPMTIAVLRTSPTAPWSAPQSTTIGATIDPTC